MCITPQLHKRQGNAPLSPYIAMYRYDANKKTDRSRIGLPRLKLFLFYFATMLSSLFFTKIVLCISLPSV